MIDSFYHLFMNKFIQEMFILSNMTGTALGMSSLVGFSYAMIGPVLVGALTKEEVILIINFDLIN